MPVYNCQMHAYYSRLHENGKLFSCPRIAAAFLESSKVSTVAMDVNLQAVHICPTFSDRVSAVITEDLLINNAQLFCNGGQVLFRF